MSILACFLLFCVFRSVFARASALTVARPQPPKPHYIHTMQTQTHGWTDDTQRMDNRSLFPPSVCVCVFSPPPSRSCSQRLPPSWLVIRPHHSIPLLLLLLLNPSSCPSSSVVFLKDDLCCETSRPPHTPPRTHVCRNAPSSSSSRRFLPLVPPPPPPACASPSSTSVNK